jgi:hypothetical protein
VCFSVGLELNAVCYEQCLHKLSSVEHFPTLLHESGSALSFVCADLLAVSAFPDAHSDDTDSDCDFDSGLLKESTRAAVDFIPLAVRMPVNRVKSTAFIPASGCASGSSCITAGPGSTTTNAPGSAKIFDARLQVGPGSASISSSKFRPRPFETAPKPFRLTVHAGTVMY